MLFRSEFQEQLKLTGHDKDTGPTISRCCQMLLDTEVMSWSIEQLQENFGTYDLHVVPNEPFTPKPLSEETCQSLGINIHQRREVHGKIYTHRLFNMVSVAYM